MRRLLIIKTGSAYPAIRRPFGDFEDFIAEGVDIPHRKILVIPVFAGDSLPEPEDIFAVILTGSDYMVTDFHDWSVYTARWLTRVRSLSIPTLGICFGHQLLAQAHGGTVDYNPAGEESGTVSIELTATGKKDRLFGVLPETFVGHALHAQSVVKLPPGAVVLAQNGFDSHQGFRLGDNIWGVQFHPEFSANVVRKYLEEDKEHLIGNGYDFDQLYASVQENIYGKLLLRRFAQLAENESPKTGLSGR